MIDLIYEGGPVFTIPLSLILLTNIVLITRVVSFIVSEKFENYEQQKIQTDYVQYLGILAVTLGLLGQTVGLYEAFKAIGQWGKVSPDVLFAGLRVSSITTIMGLMIFCFSFLSWLILTTLNKSQKVA